MEHKNHFFYAVLRRMGLACRYGLWEIPLVNEILYMERGRVTIPKECRERRGLGDNARLLFMETKSGALVLKPISSPSKSFIAALRDCMDGVEIPEMHFQGKPRL